MSTVDELLKPMSVEDCRDFIYAQLEARGANTSTWKPGAVARTIIYAAAVLGAAFSTLQVAIARSAYLDYATGVWLTLLARFVYGVRRLEGSFATGHVVATNAGGGIYSGDPDDLIFRAGDREYRNTEPFTIGALSTVTIPVRAVEIGTAGDAAAGAITSMTTPLPGVTVTNPLALVGTDPETDEQLRARCRAFLGSLSPNGPKEAYVYVATTSRRPDGSAIGVTRVETVPDGYGNVEVFVATASGSVSGEADNPETDLGIVSRNIKTMVEPIGVNAIVQSAIPKTINVTYEIWIRRSSLTDTQIETRIESALVTWASSIRIGGHQGYVYVSAIKAAIARSLDEPPIRIEITVPAADVVIAANEAPAIGLVTATAIHQISEGV